MRKAAQSILMEDAYYTIAAPNGRVLEVANYNTENGAAIQLWDYAGEAWQQWSFVAVGTDTYQIKNRFTGKVIDLALRGTAAGTLLHQWNSTGHRSQEWKLEPAARGTRIRSILAGKCVDLAEMSTANGARAQIWSDVEGGNQEWAIHRVQQRRKAAVSDGHKAPAPQKSRRQAAESSLVKKLNKTAGGSRKKK